MQAVVFLLSVLVAIASAESLHDCKTAYASALSESSNNAARCKALVALATCINENLESMQPLERMSAQGFVDAALITSSCDDHAIPEIKHASDEEAPGVRERRAADTVSIWDIGQKFDNLVSTSVNRNDFAVIEKSVADLQASASQTLTKAREDILLIVEARMATLTNTVTSVMTSTLSSMQALTTSSNDETMARLTKLEADLKSIGTNVTNQVLAQIVGKSDSVKTAIANATNLASTVDARIATLETQVAPRAVTAVNSTKVNLDRLFATFGKTSYLDKSVTVFRYNTWHTYSQAQGSWYCSDNPAMFGGINPSTWTDGNGYAYQMSSDKNILRTLFTKKIFGGWNANVQSDEWYYYSSTNGEVAGALFRIRNVQSVAITWRTFFYFSSFSGWSEGASVAMNGVNQWTYSGTCGFCTINVDLAIPANRVSTVIFIATSGYPSTTRTNLLVFYNDCLKLPAGLEYVDDLDYATGGWEA